MSILRPIVGPDTGANTECTLRVVDTPDRCAAIQRDLDRLGNRVGRVPRGSERGNAMSCFWRRVIPGTTLLEAEQLEDSSTREVL